VGRLLWIWLGFFAGWLAAAQVVKRVIPSRGDAESDEVALMAVFDGTRLDSEAKAFRGGSMVAWYGGVDADLRKAELAAEARLNVAALFGGIQLLVPTSWRVQSNVRAVAGGVDVGGKDPEDPGAPLLVLDGYAFCGGVAVSRRVPEGTA
jgi:Cell wall-active antibiotics response 4TMS YvqF